MGDPRELELLVGSRRGDWQCRADLYRKFILGNPRVIRRGTGYKHTNDFLHDVLTNVLRTAHSYHPGQGSEPTAHQTLDEWVESVAAWTALERERLNEASASGDRMIRLCAAIEADEPDHRTRLTSYVPPQSTDSLGSQIKRLVGEPQFTLLSTRAKASSSWADVAAAAGKPLNTIGPMLVKSVDRLSRLFGAPPPLNPDLESIFSPSRKESSGNQAERANLKGRVISIQLDPIFYKATPELRAIGLAVPEDVRTITLWDTARSPAAPTDGLRDHLSKCHYCTDVLRALRSMQRALEADPDTRYLLCPGGVTLLEADEKFHAIHQHLAECPLCAKEREHMFADPEDESKAAIERNSVTATIKPDLVKKIGWAAAVVLLLVAGYFVQHRYSAEKNDASASTASSEKNAQPVTVDPRYSDLAQNISLEDNRWVNSVLPQNRYAFSQLVSLFRQGNVSSAMIAASQLGQNDPGVKMLYAVGLYSQKDIDNGYQAMLKAEEMSPRNSFRCWAMLQSALMAGDMKIIAREVQHLSSDAEYGPKAKALLDRARARG